MLIKKTMILGVRFLLVGGILLSLFSDGISCTLFGAIGSSVEGGGVLIGKTRDRPEPLEQVFVDLSPKTGVRYRGIATRGTTTVTSGMNEKGLVVVSAAASNLPKEKKVTSVGKILMKASSVDEAIGMVKKGDIQGPIHFLVADAYRMALMEVIDDRRHAVLVRTRGTLSHTNHFVLPELKNLNRTGGSSSATRGKRIEALLEGGPFTRDRFIAMTKDHDHGPGNNSICRHFEWGSKGTERTVSAAVFYLPREGAPEMWVSLGQPCTSEFEKHSP